MALFNFGGGKKFIVFDIGNASVGGALIERKSNSQKNTRPILKVLAIKREEVTGGKNQSFNQLLKNTIQATEKVAQFLSKSVKNENTPVFVILASPWYSGKTSFVRIEKTKPFEFNKEILAEVLKEETGNFKRELSKKLTKTDKEAEFLPIEPEIIQIKLNGYETSEPLGNMVNEAIIYVSLNLSRRKVLDLMEEKILLALGDCQISFYPFPVAYFRAVKKEYPQKKDFMLIDISGEITEISLVRKGVLLETATFPMGRNFVLRQTANGLKRNFPETNSLFKLSPIEKYLKSEEKEKFSNALNKSKKEWLREYQKILSGLVNNLYLPDEIFLSADDDVFKIFSSWISDDKFSQYALTHEKFRITPPSFGRNIVFDSSGNKPLDQFLSIGAIFAQRHLS